MALRFIGVDPNTPNSGSPTVWVDEADGSLIIQGWKITDDSTVADIKATGAKWDPIPEHETVLRIPERMKPILREALGDS
jgi:hypothetical protein